MNLIFSASVLPSLGVADGLEHLNNVSAAVGSFFAYRGWCCGGRAERARLTWYQAAGSSAGSFSIDGIKSGVRFWRHRPNNCRLGTSPWMTL